MSTIVQHYDKKRVRFGSKQVALDTSGFTCLETFTVTHPFSPFSGKTFALDKTVVKRGKTYLHFNTDEGTRRSIPADWTDYDDGKAVKDTIAQSAIYGRCVAYYDDLIKLDLILKDILDVDLEN